MNRQTGTNKDPWGFSQLEQGWFQGEGKPLSPEGIHWLVTLLDQNYDVTLPQMYVYPTPEGGVRLEWSIGTNDVSLDVDIVEHKAYWHVLDLATNEDSEQLLNLNNQEDVSWWLRTLKQLARDSRQPHGVASG